MIFSTYLFYDIRVILNDLYTVLIDLSTSLVDGLPSFEDAEIGSKQTLLHEFKPFQRNKS